MVAVLALYCKFALRSMAELSNYGPMHPGNRQHLRLILVTRTQGRAGLTTSGCLSVWSPDVQNGFDISMDRIDISEHMFHRSQTEFRPFVYGTEGAPVPWTVSSNAYHQASGFTGRRGHAADQLPDP